MKIKYSDGKTIQVSNEDEARQIIDKQYPDAFYGECEALGYCDRTLVWENEQESQNNDGSNAICEIIA